MNRKYFWTFFTLIAVYVTLAFTLPSDPEILQKYEITQSAARWLNLTIIIPIVAVYFAALYGFLRFKSYAKSVKGAKEGKPLSDLSTGLMVLAFGLPIASIMGSLINYFSFQHTDLVGELTIIRNYISLMFPLIAFLYIARGSEGLLATLKNKKIPTRPILGLLGPIIMASLFTWLVTSQPQSSMAAEPIYYMPNWIVILTLAVPYVYVWCIAIRAAYGLYVYKDRVRGLIYKRAIDYLAKGIMVIISLSILIQLVTTLSGQLNRLNLTPLLLIVYILVALYALGYGFVARGANKLKQIEEV